MNIKKNSATAALCVLLGIALAGCAATRTQRAPGEVVDDKVISSHVNSALSDDPRTKSRDIEVQTRRGTVQLNGFVDSADAKARATEVARNVPNVEKVDNNLIVRETKSTMGENIDDTVVTAKVKAALVGDPVTKAREIGVTTLHGVVQLSGFVDTEAERTQATVVAKGVGGVREVRNDLAIKQN